MSRGKHFSDKVYFPSVCKRGKHTSNKTQFFGISKCGKHAINRSNSFIISKCGKRYKNELVVYNPIYARISSCLSSLVIATSLLTFATLGKYKGTLASSDTARVAKYMVNLISSDTAITEFIPNTTRTIEFSVKNFDSAEQSEVKLRYRIIIEMPENVHLPIDYKLYKLNNEDVKEEVSIVAGMSDYIEVDTTNVEHRYIVELTWRDGYNQIEYQNLTDNITISVDSEQID